MIEEIMLEKVVNYSSPSLDLQASSGVPQSISMGSFMRLNSNPFKIAKFVIIKFTLAKILSIFSMRFLWRCMTAIKRGQMF